MKEPVAWNDLNLLQDEPFLTHFLMRSNAEPSSRKQKDSIDWDGKIYEELDKENALSIARAWLQLAFAKSLDESVSTRDEVLTNHEGVRVFINFYWLLYQDSKPSIKGHYFVKEDAKRFLTEERSKRGYYYGLPGNTATQTNGRSRRTVSGSNTKVSTSKRRPAKHPRPSVRGDPYDGETEDTHENDSMASYHVQPGTVTNVVADCTHIPTSSQTEALLDVLQTSFSHSESTNGISISPVIPISPERTYPGTNTGSKRKAVATSPSNSSVGSSSEDNAPAHEGRQRHHQHRVDHDSKEDAYLSPLTDLAASDESSAEGGSIERKETILSVEQPSTTSSRRPRRSAANVERLASLMHKETEHEARLLRGQVEGFEDDFPLRTGAANQKQRLVKNRRLNIKTTGMGADAQGKAQPIAAPTEAMVQPDSVHSLSLSTAASGALSDLCDETSCKTKATMRQHSRLAGKSKKSSRRSKKHADGSLPNRPTKQRRGNGTGLGGSLASIVTQASIVESRKESVNRHPPNEDSPEIIAAIPSTGLNASPVRVHDTRPFSFLSSIHCQASSTSSQEPVVETNDVNLSTQDAGISSDCHPDNRPLTRKRIRTVPEEHSSAQTGDERSIRASRPTAPLPKQRLRNSELVIKPSAQHTVLQTALNISDVDRNLRQAATEGLMGMDKDAKIECQNDFEEHDEAEGQNELLDSSDDELPLKDVIGARKSLTVERDAGSQVSVEDESDDITPLRDVLKASRILPIENNVSLSHRPIVLKTTEHTPSASRPRLHVRPPIWAQSRQEVCESFDWFRSYQGGVYFMKDMVKGYLLSAFSSNRDVFAHEGRMIISHGGGKAESLHTKEGQSHTHEADDQLAEDKSVRALLNTYALKRPLVLLVDDKYTQFPYDLAADEYTYVVLGFYRIVAAWAEQQPAKNARGFVVRYKFAFRWCEEQGQPWWTVAEAPQGDSLIRDLQLDPIPETSRSLPCPNDHTTEPAPAGHYCCVCQRISPLVYAEHRMCLNSRCAAFWKTEQGAVADAALEYAADFLKLTPDRLERLENICPPLPATTSADGITTSRVFCKGWHCKRCGRLSSRYKWEHWECRFCSETHTIPGRLRDPKEFWRQKAPKFWHHEITDGSGIIAPETKYYKTGAFCSPYHQYILPEGRGCIYLITSRQLVNAEADQIFREYQEQASDGTLLFRRCPLRAHKCRGTLLTNYFSQNSGEPYQYVGGTDNTVPLEAAPSAVVHALDLIQKRMHEALGMPSSFNEVLSAAYMEKQQMAFHSDAEKGLGPVVASLSLGSAAYMHFRMHKSSRNALTLYLRHGDVVVMEGADVQKYYEHTVVPVNFRIAATARTINAK